jgi:hypothetical protein
LGIVVLDWLFGRDTNPARAVDWFRLPSLSVVVFGALDRTPDIQRIRSAMLARVSGQCPASAQDIAANPVGVREFYQKELEKKLDLQEAHAASELGFTDRASRLFSVAYALSGIVWLLLEEGAVISDADANSIPLALSEFALDSKCAVVQGSGYHAFVRAEFMMRACVTAGRLSDAAVRIGAVSKRVRYITLDPRRKAYFEL